MPQCNTKFKQSPLGVDNGGMEIWIFKKFFARIFVWLLSIVWLSCLEDGGVAGRPLIQKFGGSGDDGERVCGRFYDLEDGSCLPECRPETHPAGVQEKEQLLEEIKGSSLEEERRQEILGHIENAEGVCVAGTGILRPDNSIFVVGDYCTCIEGKPDSLNDCSRFCSKRKDTSPTLYGSVELGEKVVNNPRLGNLKNWCSVELSADYPSPGCVLEVVGDTGTLRIPLVIPSGSNSFSANLSTLDYETPYVAKIVEAESGSNVSSDTFQIYRKKFPEDSSVPVGPLKVVPVSQYTCLSRPYDTDEVNNFYIDSSKIHYYFVSGRRPARVSPENNFVICHDINAAGVADSPLYERLELIPQHFMIWDESDIRFYDQDKNDETDINQHIKKILLEQYDFKPENNIDIFTLFPWPNHPSVSTPPNLGFIMQPWVNSTTGRSLCPTQKEYHGDDPIFKVLKELVGVDTEGLFVAEREALSSLDSKGKIVEAPQDILLIREKLLKKIWFYYEDGRYFVPDEVAASQKNLYLYWPPDIHYPYVRKSTQHIYAVKSAQNIGKKETVGLNTSIRTPDKRIGCVPTMGEP